MNNVLVDKPLFHLSVSMRCSSNFPDVSIDALRHDMSSDLTLMERARSWGVPATAEAEMVERRRRIHKGNYKQAPQVVMRR